MRPRQRPGEWPTEMARSRPESTCSKRTILMLFAGTDATKKKIGLLTNQTGVDLQGRRTIDVLAKAPGVSLEAIFSPEHGVTGTLDTTDIANSKDAATGIPVYSVYGVTKAARRPPLDVLKNLDAVVIDIQDAGTRFYTYEATWDIFWKLPALLGRK